MERNKQEEEQKEKYKLHYFRKNNLPVLTETELQEESDLIYQALMKGQSAGLVTEQTPAGKTRKLWYPAAAAAAVALIVSGLYFFNSPQTDVLKPGVADKDNKIIDVAPGIQTATLTLADGKKIILSAAANGKIAEQNGVSVSKTADGKLVYALSQSNKDMRTLSNVFNTLSTVKGQQYQVVLPDGTKVWLNAASSITYPANFANLKDRKVQLSGEAYFEVAKDKQHPFIVKTDQQQVEVLGTHFNVNSYGDEKATKTTLLEGSVKVSNGAGQKVLLPGQQSQVASNKLLVGNADLAATVAWKNGDFVFDEEDFSSVLRQLERWYNVKITDHGDRGVLHLGGAISRSKNLSTVLHALEVAAEVKFKVNGRSIVVE